MTTTIDPTQLYSFSIEQLPKLRPLWAAIQTRSNIPEPFDQAVFERHVRQPYLRNISNSLERAPSEDIIATEFANADPMSFYREKFPMPVHSFLEPANGVVHLTKFMAHDREREDLAAIASEIFGASVKTRGHFLYPPGGFKEWHTNYNHDAGWRMYIIDVDKEESSFFRYVDPNTNELKTVVDKKGTVNFFKVDSNIPFWHCIKSEQANRFSRGFLVPDNWFEIIDPSAEENNLLAEIHALRKENAILKQAIAVLSKPHLNEDS